MENENKNPLEDKLPSAQEQLEQIEKMTEARDKINEEALLHTYSNDIAAEMKEKKGSVLKIALAEQERQREYQEVRDPKATKNILYIFFSFLLVLASIALVVYVLVIRTRPVVIQTNSGNLPSLVFTENQTLVDLTGLSQPQAIRAIQQAQDNTQNQSGAILNLFTAVRDSSDRLVKQPVQLFLPQVTNFLPENLLNTLRDDFTLGSYNIGGEESVFIIFSVKNFDNFFVAMNTWEQNLLDDTIKLFNYPTLPQNIFDLNFANEYIGNKEARVLRDGEGNFVAGYIFINDRYTILGHDIETLQEVTRRIETESLNR